MEKTPFKRFLDLIAFDQAFVALEKEIAQVAVSLEKTVDSLSALEHALEKERAHVRDLRKEVDVQELHMRMLDEQERAARERTSSAANPREFQALTKEFDRCKQLQHEHEELLVAVWNRFEQAQKAFEGREATFTEQRIILEAQREVLSAQKALLQGKIEEHERTRKQYVEGLPEEWVEKYTRMRSSVENPIVPVIAGTCGGCSYTLTRPVMMQLDVGKMISCSGCYRLLYKESDQGPATTA